MAQGLYLTQKLGLSQVLAPQLQQSLALLQAPTLELKAMVEQELQQNVILEEIPSGDMEQRENADGEGSEDGEGPSAQDPVDPAEPPKDMLFDPATEKPSNEAADPFQREFQELMQHEEWRENLGQTNLPARNSPEEEEKREFVFNSLVAPASLQENLMEQVRLSELRPEQRVVAEVLIGNLDDYGFLKVTLEELAPTLNLPVDQIQPVLEVIQTFHPAGVGARNLQECLLLQLQRAGAQKTLEYRILSEHMEALGKRRIPEIARALQQPVEEVQKALARISRLEPRPGRAFLQDNDQYILPEVFVSKSENEFVVTTNNEQIPHLRIRNYYKDLMARPDATQEIRDYIREKIRAGKFLIKSLHQRQQTILNIAKEIVRRQCEFMDHGVAFLKPLTMVQVAEVVGVHETTVSRAVSGKYMMTPQGIYEMKYFFTSGIQTATGETLSNTSVKDMIDEIFASEDSSKPLSDQEVVKMLADRNVVIARRTVAKYRAELNILPSNLRKVY